MPSVIALLEVREARAWEELESWLEVLREAEQCVQDAAVLVVPDGGSAPAPAPPVLREGYDPRQPIWRAGMGVGALAGVYRQVFEAVLVASEPISAQELTRVLGRDATRLN
ncbi:hypothetical protein OG568_56525 (plasmid) [Streptomyces sp. NBC_01450]|uniref:hypothetical protein n=1 Tax=Streptomyces sp. NBC_01450 TaxID=2903871 RepID=UPI002E36985F|nr:hypothetical protein [Streptomyces sp. NBC_01450]